MNPTAESLFQYLYDVIYAPSNAKLDVNTLPEDFQEFGNGLIFFAECVIETKALAQALSKGNLHSEVPKSNNEVAAPLKALHASLRHLTWQAQQIAKGDYQQRVDFMGDFSTAFNSMAEQLEERRRLDTLEKSKLQQYINLILSNTPNILLSFDTEGKAVFASESFLERNYAFNEGDIQGKTFAELFSPLSSEEFVENLNGLILQVCDSKKAIVIEQELRFEKDGDLRTYLVYIAPMSMDDETFMGVMIIFDDITEVVRAREMAEKNARARSEFLGRMSHEMRTPMNAILGMTALGKASKGDEKKDYSFKKIEDAAAHLLGVINDVLDMSMIEGNKLELVNEEFRLDRMLHQVHGIIGLLAAEKEQEFTSDISDDLPECIISDERRLNKVIVNILSNAVKFTPEKGSVSLTVNKIEEVVGYCVLQFIVSDSGIGISEEQKSHLFVPFEQVDGGSSRKFGGSGLGLAISKRIIEMMDGSIWVESTPNRGSTFTFDITVQLGACENEDSDAGGESDSTDGIFSGKRILIAEDVDINREIIASLLENTGIEISFAVNGEEAVEIFTSDPELYQLILMDLQMPVVDGFEATRRIRASGVPEASSVPIIAMTANSSAEDVENCLSAGMNSHLSKPVNIDEVIREMRGRFDK